MSVIVVGDREASIEHLAPAIMQCGCVPYGRDISIQVEYSNHCYTCGFDEAVHTAEDILLRDPHARVFHAVRHQLSAMLPVMVASLPTSKVHQTGSRRNYVYSILTALPTVAGSAAGAKITYQMFFTLRRAPRGAGHDLRLFVESAYPLAGPPLVAKRPSAVRFAVLALKVAMGQPVTFAAR